MSICIDKEMEAHGDPAHCRVGFPFCTTLVCVLKDANPKLYGYFEANATMWVDTRSLNFGLNSSDFVKGLMVTLF